ncbi:MAG: hypothetical protein IJ717_09045 [Treponema sp.]|nr:hypothetical protein [Treponema sp.]
MSEVYNYGPDDEDDEPDETMDDLWDEYGPDSMDDPEDSNWDTSERYDD